MRFPSVFIVLCKYVLDHTPNQVPVLCFTSVFFHLAVLFHFCTSTMSDTKGVEEQEHSEAIVDKLDKAIASLSAKCGILQSNNPLAVSS